MNGLIQVEFPKTVYQPDYKKAYQQVSDLENQINNISPELISENSEFSDIYNDDKGSFRLLFEILQKDMTPKIGFNLDEESEKYSLLLKYSLYSSILYGYENRQNLERSVGVSIGSKIFPDGKKNLIYDYLNYPYSFIFYHAASLYKGIIIN